MLELFIHYGGPTGLRSAGKANVLRLPATITQGPLRLIEEIFTALTEQTVTVAGTNAVEIVVPRVAAQNKELKTQPAILAAEVEKLVDDFLFHGLDLHARSWHQDRGSSTPGHRRRSRVQGRRPPGCVCRHRTDLTVLGRLDPWRASIPVWNKALKNALFRSAWVASCHDPISMA